MVCQSAESLQLLDDVDELVSFMLLEFSFESLTSLYKNAMYCEASLSVCILLSLSDGRVGMI